MLVCLTVYVMCFLNEDVAKPLLPINFKNIYTNHCYSMYDQIFRVLSFSIKSKKCYFKILKHYSIVSGKARSPLWERVRVSRWNLLRVKIATVVYKVATATLDKDLASKMKKKKHIDIERKDLRKKLDMLRLRIHEREVREA